MTAKKKNKFKLPKHLWALFHKNDEGDWVFTNVAYKFRWNVQPNYAKPELQRLMALELIERRAMDKEQGR